mgnify:CR=1 FL=1
MFSDHAYFEPSPFGSMFLRHGAALKARRIRTAVPLASSRPRSAQWGGQPWLAAPVDTIVIVVISHRRGRLQCLDSAIELRIELEVVVDPLERAVRGGSFRQDGQPW